MSEQMLRMVIEHFNEELRNIDLDSHKRELINCIEAGVSLSTKAQSYEDAIAFHYLCERSIEKLRSLDPNTSSFFNIEITLRKVYDPILSRHISDHINGDHPISGLTSGYLFGIKRLMEIINLLTEKYDNPLFQSIEK